MNKEFREQQKISLVIGCNTVGGGGILVALADDDFNAEYDDFSENVKFESLGTKCDFSVNYNQQLLFTPTP